MAASGLGCLSVYRSEKGVKLTSRISALSIGVGGRRSVARSGASIPSGCPGRPGRRSCARGTSPRPSARWMSASGVMCAAEFGSSRVGMLAYVGGGRARHCVSSLPKGVELGLEQLGRGCCCGHRRSRGVTGTSHMYQSCGSPSTDSTTSAPQPPATCRRPFAVFYRSAPARPRHLEKLARDSAPPARIVPGLGVVARASS
jgi:hypothetical protein